MIDKIREQIEPHGIGCDKAELDALKDQIAVDTAIIKAKNTEIKKLGAVVEAAKYIKFRVHSHAADQQFPAHYELTTEEYIPLRNALAALDQEQE